VINYKSDDPKTIYQGFAQLFKGTAYVLLLKPTSIPLKSAPQLSVIATGLKAPPPRKSTCQGQSAADHAAASPINWMRTSPRKWGCTKSLARRSPSSKDGKVVYAKRLWRCAKWGAKRVTPTTLMMIGSTTNR